MNCYLLYDDTGLYLAFGTDAVEAAISLIKVIGPPADPNRFSVSGSWPCDPAKPINVGRWWPHFTFNPSERLCKYSSDTDPCNAWRRT